MIAYTACWATALAIAILVVVSSILTGTVVVPVLRHSFWSIGYLAMVVTVGRMMFDTVKSSGSVLPMDFLPPLFFVVAGTILCVGIRAHVVSLRAGRTAGRVSARGREG